MPKKASKEKALKKKEAKQKSQADKVAKREEKARRKELAEEGEEDIEIIMARIAAKEASKAVTIVETTDAPVRANASIVRVGDEMILFGGEYFDGAVNFCYDDVYRYNIAKNTWKCVSSPTSPAPRGSHQAVVYKDSMFVHGGEFATANQYYHHRDIWRFQLSDNSWTQIHCTTGPSPRSGHRSVLWKHYWVMFGGFYEAVRESKWFNDLWLFDFQTEKWLCIEFPSTAMIPTPRSGHQMMLVTGTNDLLMYGGYSEVKVPGQPSKSTCHTDMWLLHMEPFLSTRAMPHWERIRQTGQIPEPRVGFAMLAYKDRAVLFGGVADKDQRDDFESRFYNDLYSFDIARRRWYELEIKEKTADGIKKAKRRNPKGGAEDSSTVISGREDDNVFDEAFDDADDDDAAAATVESFDDNAYYYWENGELKKMDMSEGDDEPGDGEAPDGAATVTAETSHISLPDESVKTRESSALPLTTDKDIGAVDVEAPIACGAGVDGAVAAGLASKPVSTIAPCGRFRSLAFLDGNLLYIYGGLVENRSVEVTLDDLWCVDLRTRSQWRCVVEGTMASREWHGEADEVAVPETVFEPDEGDGEGSDEEKSDEEDDEEEEEEEGSGSGSDEDAPEPSKEERDLFSMSLRERQKRIRQLRDVLGLGDPMTTPAPKESLEAFFRRTASNWVTTAGATLEGGAVLPGKELRRLAFGQARARYDELWPVMEELNELEVEQERMEAMARASVGTKKGAKAAGAPSPDKRRK